MEHQFWPDKWAKGEIGFHKPEPHPLLQAHIGALGLAAGARVFLPLCGKTVDIAWLRGQGFRVAGAELSSQAVEALFEAMGVVPDMSEVGALRHYRSEGIDLFTGDVFALSGAVLGRVDAVYDRAALVALPDAIRARYAVHLVEITRAAPQLLIAFDYDQAAMDGPPFSVPEAEVRRLYEASYRVSRLGSVPVEGGLKGRCPAMEDVWLLGGAG